MNLQAHHVSLLLPTGPNHGGPPPCETGVELLNTFVTEDRNLPTSE